MCLNNDESIADLFADLRRLHAEREALSQPVKCVLCTPERKCFHCAPDWNERVKPYEA